MTFKDGFDAVDRIKGAGEKLSETIIRLEKLEGILGKMDSERANISLLITDSSSAISELSVAVTQLIEAQTAFTIQASAQLTGLKEATERLPSQTEFIVSQKLDDISEYLEARLTERFREELKDTRASLRDSVEAGLSGYDKRIADLKSEIVAEMPKTLFGRRGR
ncbi:hypothetical protein [Falsihalocynthiibacter arcticus]|uniref:Uncharacterized protein n=1 Tax=Falsihalocynthiibacter arcticus TaxID=1579316 RepID=A0A126V3C2_9RHOB|nr:hypothetical protein [Falsihalocynthiibacter arcticus]AML52831.1 hypothetical protein RC74_17600 [Falsihalocynthiibacter arcticus]